MMSGKTCANENRCDVSDTGLPAAITVDGSQGSVWSNLYDDSPTTPPLHVRVMSLFDQVPEKTGNYICGMDIYKLTEVFKTSIEW